MTYASGKLLCMACLKQRDDELDPEAVIKDELEMEPAELPPPGVCVALCDFCHTRQAAQELYFTYDETTRTNAKICRACASKALHDLLDPSDPDAIRDAQTAEDDTLHHSWYSRDMDKMLRAGLRIFRVCERELLLKEYSRVIGGVGSPDYISGSWKHVERFQTKKALKERMAELEQDEHIIFENHL